VSYLSDDQKTGIIVLAILCGTALIMTWSIIGYRTALYHAQHPAKDPVSDEGKALKSCLDKHGVPILDRNTQIMTDCKGL
jgi:hypothetical protein